MPYLYTRITNSTFQTRDGGEEHASPEIALEKGVASALAIAVDEFKHGQSNTAVEVVIEGFDEVTVRRSVLSVSVCELHTA